MRPGVRSAITLLALGVGNSGLPAQAQLILVDRRPDVAVASAYEIEEVAVDGTIRDQVAEVQVSQTFHNPGSQVLEAEFLFPLPEDGAIDHLTLLADGRELPGRLLSKDEARKIYEEIVRRKRDPALLEYMGRGLYRTSVFPIPPGAERRVTIRYTQLLRRDGDVVEFGFPFATQKFTAKPIERLDLRLDLRSREPIKSLYSPGHDVEIDRSGDREALVKFSRRSVVPTADFRLFCTLSAGEVGATVLSHRPDAGEDGYFLLLASPEVQMAKVDSSREKTVIFVLDRSGSMSGKKIEQARESLRFVLDNLREDDLFNIVVYDDRVETFAPELQRFDGESRRKAVRFVENLRPGGSTNIGAALDEALGMIRDDQRPAYVLFLTDGLPTVGERNEATLAENARKANAANVRLFCFGVGHDVNARLLDRLSRDNSGASEYVLPDEDIEAHVARVFSRMTSPVLTDIEIELPGTDINRTYPRRIPDLFAGGQLVWVGRYQESGDVTVEIRGKVGGERRTISSRTRLADVGESKNYAFVERLWAIRRVGDIVDQIDLQGENEELVRELVALSKAHGILTPYTSFLADETTDLSASTEHRRRAADRLSSLSEASGARGVGQRLNKQLYQHADQAADSFAVPAPAPGGPGRAEAAAGRESLARRPAGTPGALDPVRMSGMGGGMGGMMGMMSPASRAGLAVARDLEGQEQVVGTVRTIGSKTFYWRGDQWMDAEVAERDDARVTVIEQYSDAYFDLARSQSAEENRSLTFTEPVTVLLGGRVYRIVPPAG